VNHDLDSQSINDDIKENNYKTYTDSANPFQPLYAKLVLLKINLLTRFKPPLQFLLAVFLVLSGSSSLYDRSQSATNLRVEDLPVLSLDWVRRILVIAPHPDNEILASGGLMQIAFDRGIDVRVAIITNGDGQYLASLALHGQPFPQNADFVNFGELRQRESLAALEHLGVGSDHVYFLGYPDRGLEGLWLADWNQGCPLASRYTRVNRSPYGGTYNPEASYCGRDLVQDLRQIINSFQPDLVVLRQPNDKHPEHSTASAFTRLALSQVMAANPEYRPQAIGYIIHYGLFPKLRGTHITAALLPPAPLSGKNEKWMKLNLSPLQAQTKLNAMKLYGMQVRLMGKFLFSFARANELYVTLPTLDFLPLEYDSLTLPESDNAPAFNWGEPVRESTRRLLVPGTDLVGWDIARLSDVLFLKAETRGTLMAGMQYRILIKTSDGDTIVYTPNNSEMILGARSFSIIIHLEELGEPEVLGFAAEVHNGITLDRSGWNLVVLRDWLP